MKQTPLKRKTPLRKMSTRREHERAEYMRKRELFLSENPICQLWLIEHGFDPQNPPDPTTLYLWPHSTEVHHKNGRNGKNYLDETTWMALSHAAHMRIENNKSWAREKGYLGKK